MKNIILFLIFFMPLHVFGITGKDIAEKVYNSNRNNYATYKYEMILKEKPEDETSRKFYLFYQDNQKYNSKALIVFTHPKKFKKTAMLTFNKRSESSDQWLYLPALKKNRRISSSNKSGWFVGSDLTYEDLENREVQMDNHKLIKTVEKGGVKYYILESKAKDPTTSQYQKVLSKIDSSKWVVTDARFFKNNSKKAHKTIKNSSFKKFDQTWIPEISEIHNKDSNHRTILKILDVNLKKELNGRIFTTGTLENQNILNEFLK